MVDPAIVNRESGANPEQSPLLLHGLRSVYATGECREGALRDDVESGDLP